MKEVAAANVRRLKRREINDLVALYQRAFWDDPAIEFILPDERTRGRILDAYMRMMIRLGFAEGLAQTIDGEDGLRCGSVWIAPGKAPVGIVPMVRAGFLQLIAGTRNVASLRKFFALSAKIEEMHKRDIQKEHWYLAVLAVDPPQQGKGFGGLVLGPELEQADRRGLPCYVETSKTRNVTFYEKQGFVVKQEIAIPMGGPPLWTLIREPVR
jgi:ribosomal protein S18 acetylase RimI-like enzyme